MNSRIIWRSGIILLLIVTETLAQTPGDDLGTKPKLPPGPLLNSIPRPGFWSVTFSYPQAVNPQGQVDLTNKLQSIMEETCGNFTHIKVIFGGGSVNNTWKSGANIFGQNGENTLWNRVAERLPDPKAPAPQSNSFLDSTSFPGVDWISPDLFQGIIKYNNTDCLLFSKDKVDVNDSDAVAELIKKAPDLALIDEKTRYPLIVNFGGINEVFQYGQPPTHLAFPKDLADQIDKTERASKAHLVLPPAPQ